MEFIKAPFILTLACFLIACGSIEEDLQQIFDEEIEAKKDNLVCSCHRSNSLGDGCEIEKSEGNFCDFVDAQSFVINVPSDCLIEEIGNDAILRANCCQDVMEKDSSYTQCVPVETP